MPRPGIPPALEAAVIAEAAKGRSNRVIAAWLKSAHNVKTSHVTVGKLIKSVRQEVGESTRAVAISEVAPQVVGHIAALNGVAERARALETEATKGIEVLVGGVPLLDKDGAPVRVPDRELALKALELQRKTHVDVLKVAGADEGGKTDTLADLMALALKQ